MTTLFATRGMTIPSGRIDRLDLRRQALATAQLRGHWVVMVFAVAALFAIGQLVVLDLRENHHKTQASTDVIATRGEIVDRNGELLARSVPGLALMYDPEALGGGTPLVQSPRDLAVSLNRIFHDWPVDEIARRLSWHDYPCWPNGMSHPRQTCHGYQAGVLRHHISPDEATQVRALGEKGLQFPTEFERFYPQGTMASHVLGYVDPDGAGKLGMEAGWQGLLTQPDTRDQSRALSIDVRVQGAMEDELAQTMFATNAKGAAGVVLDVDTGEVLAMASLPSFNPNHVVPFDLIGDAVQGITAPAYSRATNAGYELGSVLKPITVAAAIDTGIVTNLARRYPAVSPMVIAGIPIHDDENKTIAADLNIPEALVNSSNIVHAQIGAQLGSVRLRQNLEALGFLAPVAVDIPARGWPKPPPRDDHGEWSMVSTTHVAYGHGIRLTPLHLALAYAALVNGGVWHPAILHKPQPGEQVQGRRVWKAATSAKMRQLLRAIVLDGTGRKAEQLAPGYRIGGKTGTAEKPREHGGGYDNTKNVTSFACAFPMEHPRYVVLVTLDEPHGTEASHGHRQAAWNAVPAVGRLIPRIGPTLGIMPDTGRDIDISDIAPLIVHAEKP